MNAPNASPTPTMAQFLEIKSKYPTALLFYRMGDFYETFFADAVAASEALDIALTKRGKHLGQDIPMSSVPVRAAERYFLTLIRKGFRVAVCEQMEDPAEVKKRGYKAVVNREVVRLVTPDTLTEDSLLQARQHNDLAAYRGARDQGALAWIMPLVTYVISKYWVFNQQRSTTRGWQGLLISLGISAVFLVVYWGRILDHDVSWYLVATQKWLYEGSRLYVDLVEVNPPLNFYLTIPAVLLSNALNISPSNAQFLVVAILMTVSLTWVWNILERDQGLSPIRRLLILVFIGLATVLTAINNIAQREHMLLLFILPYVFGFLILPNPDRGKSACMRAGFAAIGLCIKPHFMIYPIALTLLMIWRRKSLWPILSGANLTIFSVGATYLGLVMALHPEYLQEIVPAALHVYGAFTYGIEGVSVTFRPISIMLFILISIMVLTKSNIHKGFGAFVAVMIAAIISYLAQWTGFPYHAIPIQAFILISSIWILAQPNRSALMIVLPLVACLYIVDKQLNVGFYKNRVYDFLMPNIGQQEPGYRLMIFSISIGVPFPLALKTNAHWVSRYPSMWLIPGAVNEIADNNCSGDIESCAKIRQILDQTRRDIVTDFEKGVPDIIVIDERPLFITDKSFTFDEFLSQDPRYKKLLSNYRVKETVTKITASYLIIMERKPDR